jgi:uncharacterized SAM-binding protein YcdF (DUF218 family)
MVAMGVARDRVTIEDKARNTDENARFTAAIVHPEASQRWLIVTSAFHMPRAMGVFEKAGFHPIAYPVSFYTSGRWVDDLSPTFDPLGNLKTFVLPPIGRAGGSTVCFPDPATRLDVSACLRHSTD